MIHKDTIKEFDKVHNDTDCCNREVVKDFVSSHFIDKRIIKEKIEKNSLNTKESTKLMQEILDGWNKLRDSFDYSAPEVIELKTTEFLWNVFLKGKIHSLEDLKHSLLNNKEK